MRAPRTFALAGAGAALTLGLSACGGLTHSTDLIAGKKAFVAHCGACHTLARAGTTGVVGPDLDAAFERSLQDGMGRSTVRGVVRSQISAPSVQPQRDPVTSKPAATMPANIVRGGLADDVAEYVASAVAKPGQDTGRLADIGARKATATAKAQGGVLDIPTDGSGALAYQFKDATASAGKLRIVSKNDAQIPHDIAIEGNGVSAKGDVVQGGGTSEVDVTLKPGTYIFYCSVPGHREGGMEGTLTVK
jgi:plastocyanin